jgi:hypothetical protein
MSGLYRSANLALDIFRSLRSESSGNGIYFIATMSAASRRVIFSSKPPFGSDLNPLGVFGIA